MWIAGAVLPLNCAASMGEPDRSAHIEQLRVTVSAADAEIVADRLWGLGAGAVEEVPVDAGTVELRTVLHHVDLSQLLDGCDPRAHSRLVTIDATPAETWREFAAPVVLGDLVLCPAWCTPPDDAVGPVVLIEPGVSFGLGDHPTTMMAASAVFDAVVDGDEVADIGAGSGVLSVVAALRGARVIATEISPSAVVALHANLQLNAVSDRVQVVTGSGTGGVMAAASRDVVVANISAQVLRPMAAELVDCVRPNGLIVATGMLADADHGVDRALEAAGAEILERHRRDAWECLVARRVRG